MCPQPENKQLPNPTKDESDRSIKVRVKKPFRHAYGGVDVVAYVEDQVVFVSERCVELAGEEFVEIVGDEVPEVDPRVKDETETAAPKGRGKKK